MKAHINDTLKQLLEQSGFTVIESYRIQTTDPQQRADGENGRTLTLVQLILEEVIDAVEQEHTGFDPHTDEYDNALENAIRAIEQRFGMKK